MSAERASVTLDAALLARARAAASERVVGVSLIIDRAVEDYLARLVPLADLLPVAEAPVPDLPDCPTCDGHGETFEGADILDVQSVTCRSCGGSGKACLVWRPGSGEAVY